MSNENRIICIALCAGTSLKFQSNDGGKSTRSGAIKLNNSPGSPIAWLTGTIISNFSIINHIYRKLYENTRWNKLRYFLDLILLNTIQIK